MSIFEKDCPQCASPNPVRAVRCRCGYCFDPERLHQTDAVAQEERLYRDYLAARLVQAEAVLTVARSEFSADPENQVKAAQALLAEQALNAARAELRSLLANTARRTSPAASVVAPVAKTPPPRQPKTAKVVVVEARTARPRSAPKPVSRTPQPTLPSATERPGPVFRAVQAVKADRVMQTKKAEPKRAPAKKAAPPASVAHTQPQGVPPTPPIARPTPLAPAKAAKKECPHCTALLPVEATRCRCGFNLPTVTVDMPPVALDAETLALLAQGLDLGSRR